VGGPRIRAHVLRNTVEAEQTSERRMPLRVAACHSRPNVCGAEVARVAIRVPPLDPRVSENPSKFGSQKMSLSGGFCDSVLVF
jgi:hypothetical protein